jgi:hypothetical protein
MFSKVIRRTHMYLALFLFPWVVMYALSTLAMNHRAFFTAWYGSAAPGFAHERTIAYEAVPDTPDLRVISRQILSTLDLDGSHNVTRRKDGAIVITRNDLTTPRRLTYSPVDRTIVVEKMENRPTAVLERFHRRRGYATGYGLDTIWAVSVDLFILATVFWTVSGLWMWWEMKLTRTLGWSAALAGAAMFAMYLATI